MKRISLATPVTILAVILCACGSGESSGTSASVSSLVEQIPEDDPTRRKYMEQSATTETDLTDADEPELGTVMGAGDSVATALYDQFLANEAKALFYIDRAEYYNEYFDLDLTDGAEYTLSELAATLPENANRDDIAYAYLDCGHDGDEELAVRIGSGEYMWLYWVIKDMDGRLECIYSRAAWPRSIIEINQYGLISGFASGGAFYHTSDEGYLDATGAYHYIYHLSTTMFPVSREGYGNLSEFAIYDPNIVSVDSEDGAKYTDAVEEENADDEDLRSFILYQYDFDNTLDNKMNDAYRYVEQDIQDNNVVGEIEDASIYADDFPLKKQLINAGLQLYSQAETDEMINMQEKYYGITKEILEASEVKWTMLDEQ